MSIHPFLQSAGAAQILLALSHLAFPRRFRWREELSRLSQMNREMFRVHTLFVALTVLLMGVPMLIDPGAWLERTRLGTWAAIGFTVFWGIRLVIQWFGYSSELWRGRRFETWVHIAFTLLWTAFTTLGAVLIHHQLRP